MAVIFSPLSDEDVLDGPFRPYPRRAFIMLHDGEKVHALDRKIVESCCHILKANNFEPSKASDLRGTKDFLHKILQAIRGCGFGIVIFTEHTPASTLANIFFEAGICCILGKPVIVIKTPDAKPPSDFVRTEWVTYEETAEKAFQKDFKKSLGAILELADYFKTLGDIALDATAVDYELAFERFKQAVLIANDAQALKRIKKIKTDLEKTTKLMSFATVHETSLKKSISEFIRFLPKVVQKADKRETKAKAA